MSKDRNRDARRSAPPGPAHEGVVDDSDVAAEAPPTMERDGDFTAAPRLSRRDFAARTLRSGIGVFGLAQGLGALLPPDGHAQQGANSSTRSDRLPRVLLEKSAFVYVSPLLANGQESTCHAELWYAFLDDAVVVTVAHDRWKASALARGLDRARIWVGDHGRWKTWYGGRNEAFRQAPHFDARVERTQDPKRFAALMNVYETKYPEEIADWRDRMRQGQADGSRVMLRYTL